MTDLRPRLARDRDGIAIDALAISEGALVKLEPGTSHQIGPYDSEVVVRISCHGSAPIYLSPSADPETFNLTEVFKAAERFRLAMGDVLYAHTAGAQTAYVLNAGPSIVPALFSVTILK